MSEATYRARATLLHQKEVEVELNTLFLLNGLGLNLRLDHHERGVKMDFNEL